MAASTQPVAGQPTDRLLALYLIVAAPALLFPHRPATWLLLLALHASALLLAWPPAAMRRLLAAVSASWPRLTRVFLDWYPVALIPALYTELAPLNFAIWNGHYFDAIIQQLEVGVFGTQPSHALAQRFPILWLSELLHSGYLSYYFIIYLPPLLLYLRGRRTEFRQMVFALMLAFVLHYIFFIYFPVQGPRYLFPAPSGEPASGAVYALAHRILEAGSSQGAAFPSSHVGVSVAQTLATWRYQRRLFPVLAVLTVLLAVGAVYGGFHYAIDATCGALLGALSFAIAPAAYRRFAGRARTA